MMPIMRRLTLSLLVALVLGACSHGQTTTQTTQSVSASPAALPVTSPTAPPPSPSPSPTPAFSDLDGVANASLIDQLAQLQVLWPPSGPFFPGKPILRREFVRWLMHADAAIWAIDPSKQIRPALTGSKAFFRDVPVTDPDFGAIEGMHDAGIAIGFPDKSFKPDRPITREEALAIKAYVDCGAPDPMLADDLAQAYYELPTWRDKHAISHAYVAAIASCLLQDQGTTGVSTLDTIGRTFGAIVALDPRRPLNRAEAAAMIWKIGEQKPDLNNFPPRSAADALGPSPTPQPT
jgi:hypothetical protein